MTKAEQTAAWEAFHARRCHKARALLVAGHFHLVKLSVARVAAAVYGGPIDRQGLISAGVVGLSLAVDRYDPSRKTSFQTYAISMIRGAVYEAMREADPLSRNMRAKMRPYDAAVPLLTHLLGRAPYHDEVAAHLSITEEELSRLVLVKSYSTPHSYDTPHEGFDDGELFGSFSDAMLSTDPSPYEWAERSARNATLAEAIDTLPERDQRILRTYFWGGQTFKQIGETENVSESRIFQLHAHAIKRLRHALADQKSLFV